MSQEIPADQLAQLEEVYETDYTVGQDNVHPFGLDLHNPVFVWSGSLAVLFVLFSALFPDTAQSVLYGTRQWVIETFDTVFLGAGSIFVLFSLFLIVSPFGRIRLGGDDAQPEFSRPSWFAMLFAAGMGIGLMYFSVAEPISYFTSDGVGAPLGTVGGSEAAKSVAMGATMYHWGLHPWGIYGVVALALAFFAYNKGLPLSIRSAFYPLLGDRVWGPIGNVIDTLAVLATLFGLATSLGFGAEQATAGLHFLFGWPNSLSIKLIIIAGVTGVALWSVVQGVDGGVKVLSNINMGIALLLLLFVVLAGSVNGFLSSVGTTVAGYVQNFLPLSNPVGREDTDFMRDWTIFYWAWWISWSPFVGMFIARVSKGRTIREFLIAVLIVPTVVTILWMSAFGGGAIDQAMAGVGALVDGYEDSSLALFQMLENLPLYGISSFIGIVLALVFFITSSDSGSLVVDTITAGGKENAPVAQRVFWACAEGVVAAVLLAIGGEEALTALQAAAIATGLPFMVVLLLVCFCLYKGLRHELALMRAGSAALA